MTTITFEVPGLPQGKTLKARRLGGIVSDGKTMKRERSIKAIGGEAWRMAGRRSVETGPFKVEIIVRRRPPASSSKALKNAMLQGMVRPTQKPDYDNIAKTVGDALNGVIWRDDSQIVEGSVSKQYAEWDGTEVKVTLL